MGAPKRRSNIYKTPDGASYLPVYRAGGYGQTLVPVNRKARRIEAARAKRKGRDEVPVDPLRYEKQFIGRNFKKHPTSADA